MNLSDIHRGIKKHKKRLRIGRGLGSGRGKTAGRGHKGQGQLAGWTAHPAFEGGQMPLVRRVPKRGFHNQWALVVKAVNVGNLENWFDAGAEVTIESLRATGKVKGRFDVLKVLGDGELKKKLKISAHRFSKSALEKIQSAGGEAVVLPAKAPVVKGKKRVKAKGNQEAK
ncbi:MAG TPA: 50S ribosomal protein L15 [Pirellulales bacterium]|nr:50S ribosomal protein L15 [Pirellulales bacterium]